MNKFKWVVTIMYILLAILFLITNIAIYNNGRNFAKTYNATRMEIDYHQISFSDVGPVRQVTVRFSPSFFRFYRIDERDNTEYDIILFDSLIEPYEKMNGINNNYIEGLKLFDAIVLIISVIGLIYAIFKRYHSNGYILGSIVTFLIYINYDILSYKTFILLFGLLLSIYLIRKANFVDYNQKKWVFKK